MKKCLFFLSLMCIGFSTSAQVVKDTTYWKTAGNVSLNMSQASFSNWAAGGENATGVIAGFNLSIDYQKERNLWQNQLELAYGLNNTESDGTKKTNDKIYFSSTYGYGLTNTWYLSASVIYNTQFYKGYDYKKDPKLMISDFMAPGYLTGGIGFTWKPKSWFTGTFSAVSWRGTFVLNDSLSDIGAYGVDSCNHLLSEMGGNLVLEVKKEVMQNITLSSRLALFSNYLENAKNVDMQWDVELNMKVNKWFSANITTNMIYDDDTKIPGDNENSRPILQFKEVLAIGMQVSF